MKTKYDFVFSLGSVCACSQCLRVCNLQFASGPFDWVGGSTVVGRAKIISSDFADWLVEDDLELIDVRRTTHFNRLMRSRKTNIAFGHDFPMDVPVHDVFQNVSEKYHRRIVRLMETIRASKKVLAVYCETPIHRSPTDDEIREAQEILAAKFPGVEIDLVCFRQDDARKTPVEARLNARTIAVSVDYRKFEWGKVNHVFVPRYPIGWLMGHVETVDARTEEEKRRYCESVRRKRRARWGNTPFERWFNRKLYKLYRHCERMLIRRGMIPAEGPAPV